jgi:hypothetical protein
MSKRHLRSRLARKQAQREAVQRKLVPALDGAARAATLAAQVTTLQRDKAELNRLLDNLNYLKVATERIPEYARERFALRVAIDWHREFFWMSKADRYGLQNFRETCHYVAEDVRRKVFAKLTEEAEKMMKGERANA